MSDDFTARILDPERAAVFREILGSDRVNICSPFPSWANLPEVGEALVYMLDLDSITAEQRGRLVAYLAKRFGLAEALVDAELDSQGVPILAVDVSISVAHPGRWLS